jgi:hypothetical protein
MPCRRGNGCTTLVVAEFYACYVGPAAGRDVRRIRRRLRPARLLRLAHMVNTRAEISEGKCTCTGRNFRDFTRIESPVVVLIEEDGPTR